MEAKMKTSTTTDIDQLSINTIRTLSMDAVQAANSGHPGTAMTMAPVLYCLWQYNLRFDPQDPTSIATDCVDIVAKHFKVFAIKMIRHILSSLVII